MNKSLLKIQNKLNKLKMILCKIIKIELLCTISI